MVGTRLQSLLSMLEQNPADAFLQYAVALEYAAQNNFSEAEKRLCALREKQPDYLPLYYQLASVYEQTSRNDSAREVLQAGMQFAQQQGDAKTLRELRAVLEGLD